jgi:hypothetical protein
VVVLCGDGEQNTVILVGVDIPLAILVVGRWLLDATFPSGNAAIGVASPDSADRSQLGALDA